jgi:hypothetical protein
MKVKCHFELIRFEHIFVTCRFLIIIQWVSEALSLELKRPGRESDLSPSSSAEVKECMELYLHSPVRLHNVVLIKKAQGQVYLYILSSSMNWILFVAVFSFLHPHDK